MKKLFLLIQLVFLTGASSLLLAMESTEEESSEGLISWSDPDEQQIRVLFPNTDELEQQEITQNLTEYLQSDNANIWVKHFDTTPLHTALCDNRLADAQLLLNHLTKDNNRSAEEKKCYVNKAYNSPLSVIIQQARLCWTRVDKRAETGTHLHIIQRLVSLGATLQNQEAVTLTLDPHQEFDQRILAIINPTFTASENMDEQQSGRFLVDVNSPLFCTSSTSKDSFKAILREKPHLWVINKDSETPLIWLIEKGLFEHALIFIAHLKEHIEDQNDRIEYINILNTDKQNALHRLIIKIGDFDQSTIRSIQNAILEQPAAVALMQKLVDCHIDSNHCLHLPSSLTFYTPVSFVCANFSPELLSTLLSTKNPANVILDETTIAPVVETYLKNKDFRCLHLLAQYDTNAVVVYLQSKGHNDHALLFTRYKEASKSPFFDNIGTEADFLALLNSNEDIWVTNEEGENIVMHLIMKNISYACQFVNHLRNQLSDEELAWYLNHTTDNGLNALHYVMIADHALDEPTKQHTISAETTEKNHKSMIDMVNKLLACGINPNAAIGNEAYRCKSGCHHVKGETPLHFACQHKSLNMASAILHNQDNHYKIAVLQKNIWGHSAVTFCAQNAHNDDTDVRNIDQSWLQDLFLEPYKPALEWNLCNITADQITSSYHEIEAHYRYQFSKAKTEEKQNNTKPKLSSPLKYLAGAAAVTIIGYALYNYFFATDDTNDKQDTLDDTQED